MSKDELITNKLTDVKVDCPVDQKDMIAFIDEMIKLLAQAHYSKAIVVGIANGDLMEGKALIFNWIGSPEGANFLCTRLIEAIGDDFRKHMEVTNIERGDVRDN